MVKKQWKTNHRYLKIPIQKRSTPIEMRFYVDDNFICSRKIPLAKDGLDYWSYFDISDYKSMDQITLEVDEWCQWLPMITTIDDVVDEYGDLIDYDRPFFHFTPAYGILEDIISLQQTREGWNLKYLCNHFEIEESYPEVVHAQSRDFLDWKENVMYLTQTIEPNRLLKIIDQIWIGDIDGTYQIEVDGKKVVIAKSIPFDWDSCPYGNLLTIPLIMNQSSNGHIACNAFDELKRLRKWKREWKNITISKHFHEELAFRIAPSHWPNIRLLPAEGKTDDITAEAFELEVLLNVGDASNITIKVCGYTLIWSRTEGSLQCKNHKMKMDLINNKLQFQAYIDNQCAEFLSTSNAMFILKDRCSVITTHVDNNVSGNLEKCTVEQDEVKSISIWNDGNSLEIERLYIYGLRSSSYSKDSYAMIKYREGTDKIVYQGKKYTVYDNRVSDENYGAPDAWVINSDTVLSPVRVMDEFVWRNTRWGDMVRAINCDDVWHPNYEIKNFPTICSDVPSFNAAYHIALDTFCKCKSKEYALPGQYGMWAAGLFQGKGQGFGVWMRDSAHISIRSGNLIDPITARKTLLYTSKQGFDNGVDGPAMAIVGLWDYYLATNDLSAIYEAWPNLVTNISRADDIYSDELGLVKAPMSTSNDAFPEPENDGYCLSTENYYMHAYYAMSKLGKLVQHDNIAVQKWEQRSQIMKAAINKQYWNEEVGYYTSGPVGSEAYRCGYWETSGQESAIWSKFGIADDRQRKSVLEKLYRVAMTEYGIKLFPNRKDKNHFSGPVWVVWEAGFANAAAKEGNIKLIEQLIFQQVRNCIMNKTFYEVIDSDTGIAWRWPGQLWNAAGFVALILYGIFGMEYDEFGLYFNPAVPECLADIGIKQLYYGKIILDITILGHGVKSKIILDGEPCDYIPRLLEGRHSVVIVMNSN